VALSRNSVFSPTWHSLEALCAYTVPDYGDREFRFGQFELKMPVNNWKYQRGFRDDVSQEISIKAIHEKGMAAITRPNKTVRRTCNVESYHEGDSQGRAHIYVKDKGKESDNQKCEYQNRTKFQEGEVKTSVTLLGR
jgi:hypothetical protein